MTVLRRDATFPRRSERAANGQQASAASAADLNRLATTATNHCLRGCLIGEVTGMTIATALGWGDVASIALAVALAFLCGNSLTSLLLLRARLPFTAIVPIALAADTVSIAIMELIDNAFMLAVSGAMDAGLTDVRLCLPLLGGFVIAWPFAFAVNRAMNRRGKGHALVHGYHEVGPVVARGRDRRRSRRGAELRLWHVLGDPLGADPRLLPRRFNFDALDLSCYTRSRIERMKLMCRLAADDRSHGACVLRAIRSRRDPLPPHDVPNH